jgi:hypothetical protein
MDQGDQGDQDLGFGDLFSLRRPRDFGAGMASGAKSVVKGVISGAVGLVAAPTIGAHQDGLRGFAKGAAAGIAGAVVLPITGVCVGAAQMVRIRSNSIAWCHQFPVFLSCGLTKMPMLMLVTPGAWRH